MVEKHSRIMDELSCQKNTFEYLEFLIRDEVASLEKGAREKKMGDIFELQCLHYLKTVPEYRDLLSDVWLWKDWPDRWKEDEAGIDLVAKTYDGKYWAIQSKFYDSKNAVSKKDINSFLSESNRKQFDYRLLIATTDHLVRHARDAIDGQEKPVGLRLRGDLMSAAVTWPSDLKSKPKTAPKKKPREDQKQAINDIASGFRKHDRGQLIRACGTGKTLIGLWAMERLKAKNVLVLVPSLLLISNIFQEWTQNRKRHFRSLIVCSDVTVTRRGADESITSTHDIGLPPTTDVKEIRKELKKKNEDENLVVFCTYQSSDLIRQAQQRTKHQFDLVIADEAHRCVGSADSLYSTVVGDKKIRSAKRLFMTATPKYLGEQVKKKADELDFEINSMDDEECFGPVFHRLKFSDAINHDPPLLTDYQVVVSLITDVEIQKAIREGKIIRTGKDNKTDARNLASQIALLKTMKKYDLHKIISFHSSVSKAKSFTDPTKSNSLPFTLDNVSKSVQPKGDLWTDHINGEIPSSKRLTTLNKFKTQANDARGIISNCACLGEGIDIPTLDCVAFIDPKNSIVDIIQAVGRAIRISEHKKIGTVFIPVFVNEVEDQEKVLHSSAFKTVWQVLKALRSHDDQLAAELDAIRLKLGKQVSSTNKIKLPANLIMDIPESICIKDFEKHLYAQTIKFTTSIPPLSESQILVWADAYFEREGEYPKTVSGVIPEALGDTWSIVDGALIDGLRSLPSGSTLSNLLIKHGRKFGDFTEPLILSWADAWFEREGKYPGQYSGPIPESPGENWRKIDNALRIGLRSLPGGLTLSDLLVKHGRIEKKQDLTEAQILEWADAWFEREGKYPGQNSGPIPEAPGETWGKVNSALSRGNRGFPGESSLSQLLVQHGRKNEKTDLTEAQILVWADTWYGQEGKYPSQNSGPIPEAPGETWSAVMQSLNKGQRGLPGGLTLSDLLVKHGRIEKKQDLTEAQILDWMDAYFEREGKYPGEYSGPIPESPGGETWSAVKGALSEGRRGLPGGLTLSDLLVKHGRIEKKQDLTEAQILEWADAWFEREGKYPTHISGPILESHRITWNIIEKSLKLGRRNLRGGSSLHQLLKKSGRK